MKILSRKIGTYEINGKTFELFEITNDVLSKNGVELPLKSISTVNIDNRHEKGLEIQNKYLGMAHFLK